MDFSIIDQQATNKKTNVGGVNSEDFGQDYLMQRSSYIKGKKMI